MGGGAGLCSMLVGLVALGASAEVTDVTGVSSGNALSTVAQRHMVYVAPTGGEPALLMAVQRGARAPEGLHWYRSEDDGRTWAREALVFEDGVAGSELHFTADTVVQGNDVAVVLSYDTTQTGFPANADDPMRKVYFQRWRFDGEGSWTPDSRVTVASPPAGSAYHRATLAIDSLDRVWVSAWLRGACPASAGANCPDTLQVWVSTDGGASFVRQPDLAKQSSLGGGRILRVGSRLMALWGDYSWDNPARMRMREDAAPLNEWSPTRDAFSDGDSIYHGAAFNTVADDAGRVHLVYKDRRENLYYRRFDGTAFGERTWVDGSSTSDWALQPAITLRGDELFVCTNHPVKSLKTRSMRMFQLSRGFGEHTEIDGSLNAKYYPTAPERLPRDAPGVPCAYSVGDDGTRLKVALLELSQPEPEPEPGIGGFSDSFTSSLNADVWTVTRDTSGSTANAVDGVLTLTPEPNTGAAGVRVTSVPSAALTGSALQIEIAQTVSPTARINMQFGVTPAAGSGDRLGFWYEQGMLYLYVEHDWRSAKFVYATAFSPDEHAWWRLREHNGTVFWETSANGTSWTTRASVPTSTLPFAIDAVHIDFQTHAWGAGSPVPGAAGFRNLN